MGPANCTSPMTSYRPWHLPETGQRGLYIPLYQAIREVIKGHHLETVSDTLAFTYSALRKWRYRFAHQGLQGLVDCSRSGRPPTVTCALEKHLKHLVDQGPLQHGSVYSQWSCRELVTVLVHQTGVQVSHESVREVKKGPKLQPAHRAARSQARGPRLCLTRTRRPGVAGSPGRDYFAL